MTPATYFFVAFIGLFTLVAAVCDFRTKKLPNWLTVPAFAAALVFHTTVGATADGWSGAGNGLLFSLGGFAVGFGILLVLWLVGGGGAGDVKLMGALGAWFGAKHTLLLFLISVVFVLVLTIGSFGYQMLNRGAFATKRKYLGNTDAAKLRSGEDAAEAAQRRKVGRRLLPFGVPVALATWVLLWAMRVH